MLDKFLVIYAGTDKNLKMRLLNENGLTDEVSLKDTDGSEVACHDDDLLKIEISLITQEENIYATRAIVCVIFRDQGTPINSEINWGNQKDIKELHDQQVATVKFMKRTNTLKTEEEALKEENQNQ